MSGNAIRFTFTAGAPMDEVARTLQLARMGCEALHSSERIALELAFEVDLDRHRVTIDTANPAGRDLATLFIGFARREFGSAAVTHERCSEVRR